MLEWNVYIGGFNSRRIEVYNIFDHGGFLEDCKKAARKYAKDRDAFADAVQRSLQYFFWSKCEWEIIIDHWPHHDAWKDAKVDVYAQVMLNWDRFEEYVWEHAVELRRRASDVRHYNNRHKHDRNERLLSICKQLHTSFALWALYVSSDALPHW